MSVLATVSTVATGLLWRVTGADGLGHRLIDTAMAPDEDSAVVAAMMLTRGGDRAVPMIQEAAAEGEADLATVLLGIGSDRARTALEQLVNNTDPDVARASREALSRLDRGRDQQQ